MLWLTAVAAAAAATAVAAAAGARLGAALTLGVAVLTALVLGGLAWEARSRAAAGRREAGPPPAAQIPSRARATRRRR